MPSSCADRNTRMAISLRLATSNFWNGRSRASGMNGEPRRGGGDDGDVIGNRAPRYHRSVKAGRPTRLRVGLPRPGLGPVPAPARLLREPQTGVPLDQFLDAGVLLDDRNLVHRQPDRNGRVQFV